MDNVFIRKAIPGDEQVLAYIQTESWKAAFAGILSPEELERCTNLQKAEQKLLMSLGFKLIGKEKVSFYKDAAGNDIVFDGGIFEMEKG